MNQINPFRSSAFRITLVYILLFGISVGIILGFVYWSTIAYQTTQTQDTVNAEIAELRQAYEDSGYIGMATLLSGWIEQRRQSRADYSVYLLTDSNWNPRVANISAWPRIAQDRKDGWLEFQLGNVSEEGTSEYTARARAVVIDSRYNLLVGRGMRDLANLQELVARALLWGLSLAVVLGLIGGMMLRQTLRSRLGAINQTSRRIMQGDLQRRVATRGTGDEFDELANNLNSMLDQIENGMEGVRRVSDNIAHDLKTPLARLKNKVEELKFQVAGRDAEEVALDQILQEADGLLATFNALLRIARIEYSEQRKAFAKVDINSILTDLLELYEPLAEEREQRLVVELGAEIEFDADRDMLFQAFANLIDNAIKYTPPGGEISIGSGQTGTQWYVDISDNGPGIDESEHEKVVQRFYRIDPSRTTPGSGLGLALVFAVLKLHKLDLQFSDNDPGLRVRISAGSLGE